MFLAETTEPHGLEYLFNALKVLVIFGIMMQFVPALIWLERKMAAWIQLRDGPTKTGIPNLKIFGPLAGFGLWGLIQPVADAIKLILKEDFIPRRASKILFAIAPALVFLPIALALVVIPIGYGFEYALDDGSSFFIRYQVADFGVGILFALAALSIGVHGLALGGWASNNKYGQFGGVRASAQLISYEAAMFMVVLAMIMTYGSLSLQDMVIAQTDGNIGSLFSWGVFRQPLAFIIFFVCMYAESNRLPFDFPEAEAELIGGYHTEYGSMKFAMFFLGEYFGMIIQSMLVVLMFFGGWTVPGLDATANTFIASLIGPIVFFVKVGIFLWLYIQVRWSIPRFRFDQLMTLGWKKLIPLSLANVVITALVLNIIEMPKL